MNSTIKETRTLLVEIREELLHSEVETSVIDEIDLAILNLDDLEREMKDEDAAEYCLQILAGVIRTFPMIQRLIELILS